MLFNVRVRSNAEWFSALFLVEGVEARSVVGTDITKPRNRILCKEARTACHRSTRMQVAGKQQKLTEAKSPTANALDNENKLFKTVRDFLFLSV